MGNKVKYNLKNVYAAKMTETVTEGVSSFFTMQLLRQSTMPLHRRTQ